MIKLNGKTLSGRVESAAFDGYDISDSIFDSCYCVRSPRTGSWASIHDVVLENVSQINCDIHTAKIEDIALHNLKRMGSNPLFLWGCVFKHVKLSGKISGIKINRYAGIRTVVPQSDQEVWDESVISYYRSVDWALDISAAKFAGGVSFEAIPGDKILRDPSTQVLIRRSSLLASDWRSLDYGTSAFNISLSWFLSDSLFDSVVLAARLGSKDGKRDIEVLDKLRKAGITE